MNKSVKVWCQWLHRYLYYTGIYNAKDNTYKFVDITDSIFYFTEEQLKELEVK